MNSSRVFKLFLASIFLLSVAWKIAIPSNKGVDPKFNLIKFLESNHFDIETTAEITYGDTVIRATNASCRLEIASLASNGSDQDRFRNFFVTGTKRSFIVFRGRVYRQQPTFLTALDHLWSRHLRELGLVRYPAAILAVAENSSCDAERLPWNELG